MCAVVVLAGAACSATSGGNGFDDGAAGSGGGSSQTGSGSGGISLSGPGSGGGTGQPCSGSLCIGSTPQGGCDTALVLDSADGMDGARAIGLCQVADTNSWGVKEAQWIRSDGQPLSGALLDGKGILEHFGGMITPREGKKFLALSSGAARNPTDPGFQDPGGYWKDDNSYGAPAGYPKESPSCPGVQSGEPYDSAGLRVVIKTPTDAKSFSFDFDFYTYEYPDYICSTFNDFFVAMMTPQPSGLPDGNISFDTQGNNISVNAGFLIACNPSNAGGKTFSCPDGYGEINGTGFESNTFTGYGIQGSAATSWLNTKAPIDSPGSDITLEFMIWDSGDGVLDSTVIVDNFKFDLSETVTGTTPIPK